VPSLNKRVGGFEDGDLVGIMAEAKRGKTTLLLNQLDWCAAECGHPALLHCLEMPPKRMVRKWISMVTQTDDTPGASKITQETINQALEIGSRMKSDLLFGYQKVQRTDDVFELFHQAVRRYGVKVVGFDNLQLLVRSVEHFAQETSRLAKDFKAMAMELKILVHLIIQPHRVQEGTIISSRNVHGSSAVAKDVDCMICLHRNRIGQIKEQDFKGYLDIEENFEPQMLVRADLTRYAPGGVCTLFMDGARSTVREFLPSDLTGEPSKPLGLIPTEVIQV
jgi:replicative DNA helicase